MSTMPMAQGAASEVRWSQRVLHIVLLVLLAYDALSAFVYLLRISIFPTVGALEVFVNGGSMLLLLPALRLPVSRPQKAMLTLMLTMLGYGLLMALIRGFDENRPFVGQLYNWGVMFVGFHAGLALAYPSEQLERTILRWSWATVVLSVVGFFALEAWRRAAGGAYIGYPTQQLLLPLALFVRRRKWLPVAACLILLVLAGKRGPLLGGVAMLTLQLVRGNGLSLPKLLAMLLLLGGTGLVLWALLNSLVEADLDQTSALGRAVHKWYITFHSEDLAKATSGRSLEIQYILETRLSTTSQWIFGNGYGWYIYGGVNYATHHYTHVSYLGFVTTYGLIIGTAFLLSFPWMLFVVERGVSKLNPLSFAQAMPAYFVGYLVVAATGAILNTHLMGWMLIGLGMNAAAAGGATRRRPTSSGNVGDTPHEQDHSKRERGMAVAGRHVG